MMTRRTFCHSAVAGAATLTLGGAAVAASSVPLPAAPALGAVIHDASLAPSGDFARRLAALQVPQHGFRDDPSQLWLTVLSDRLRARPAAMAGLTTPGALFVLERWAWDLRMRVVSRVDHLGTADGRWQHIAAGAPAPLPHDAGFGAASADHLLAGGLAWGDRTHASPPRTADRSGMLLVSWVIAPRSTPAAAIS